MNDMILNQVKKKGSKFHFQAEVKRAKKQTF